MAHFVTGYDHRPREVNRLIFRTADAIQARQSLCCEDGTERHRQDRTWAYRVDRALIDVLASAVDWRGISWGAPSAMTCRGGWPSIIWIKSSAARRPISSVGIATVVRGGVRYAPRELSWSEITESCSGTGTCAIRAALRAPTPIRKVDAKTADADG